MSEYVIAYYYCYSELSQIVRLISFLTNKTNFLLTFYLEKASYSKYGGEQGGIINSKHLV